MRAGRKISLLAFLAALGAACGLFAPRPETGQPRAKSSPYPPNLTFDASRREQALAAWTQLVRNQGIERAPNPELDPVMATIRALPALPTRLRLPRLGLQQMMSEDELREAARRFIAAYGTLLGTEPTALSLVAVEDGPQGSRVLRYQQSAFVYPLVNGYGAVEITTLPDGQLLNLSSSAIPDARRVTRSVAELRPTISAEQAVRRAGGTAVRRLVIFPIAQTPSTLNLHLAWEVVGQGAPVYIDARTGEPLAAQR
ncbi:MAG: hypothetical protein C4334_03235 [Pyrinomonas sp.]|uniref:hypothetical protein n=1 Tax=Pyrinomonas sp. TaxID=2080306 RepID=UPI00332DEE2B